MIQALLVIAVVGLAIAHLYIFLTRRSETFQDYKPRGRELGLIGDGQIDPADQSTYNPLETPRPYNPANQPYNESDAEGNPVTPYINIDEKGQDVYEEDNPLDLPWIASWSVADRAARRGNSCAPLYIEEGPDGTTIEIVSKSCEGEMPHTKEGDRIVMPDTLPDPLKAEVLAHELVHIYQRRYAVAWTDFYKREWAFTFYQGPPAAMPPSVWQARRSNPDTWNPASGGPWPVWMNRWWPVSVYTNPQMPTLRASKTVWWDDQAGRVLTEAPEEWTAFFGRQSQDEHPHELAAVMIVSTDTGTEAGRRLMAWWRTDGLLARNNRSAQ